MIGAALGRHRAVRNRGHADPTAGGPQVVGDQIIGDQSVRRHAFKGRGLDDPVPQFYRAQPRRRENVGDGYHLSWATLS